MASRILTEKSTEALRRTEAPEAGPERQAGRLPGPPPPPPAAFLPPPPLASEENERAERRPELDREHPPAIASMEAERAGRRSEADGRLPQALASEEADRPSHRLGPDGKPWWESYFGPDYPLLYPEKTRESGELEVRSILAALALRPGARVIDVGCGAGRHSLALARRGFRVTGIDRSPDRLSAASIAREAEGVELDLRLADMRSLPLEGVAPADAVLSLFTSFGYFGDAENELVARGMAASLASGGRLLLDLNNRELLEEANGVRTWSVRPGGYLLDEFGFDPNRHRFHGARTLLQGGSERRFVFDHRAYSEPEIRGVLKRAGLRVLAVYGTLERTPFNHRAPRMVVLAEKP